MPNTAEEQKQQTKKKYSRRIDILLALFLILAAGMSMFVLVWKEYVLSSYPSTEAPTDLTSPAVPANPTSPTSPTSPTGPATPTGNQEIDTTDWLTYRNEEYGFEFKYPRGWEVKKQNNLDLIYNPNLFHIYLNEPVYEIVLSINKKPLQGNAETILKKKLREFKEANSNLIEPGYQLKKFKKIKGYYVGPYSNLLNAFDYIDFYFTTNEDKIFILSINHTKQKDASNIFNTILDTMEIKTTQTPRTE